MSTSRNSIFSFKRSREWNDFETWCDKNNKYAMNLLKNYMRYTVLKNRELQ